MKFQAAKYCRCILNTILGLPVAVFFVALLLSNIISIGAAGVFPPLAPSACQGSRTAVHDIPVPSA